jgi:hypothetical protein
MGVRVALGAAPPDLLRLLLWDSLRPVVFGLAVGAGAALVAGRVVQAAVFFGVSPQDPIAFRRSGRPSPRRGGRRPTCTDTACRCVGCSVCLEAVVI